MVSERVNKFPITVTAQMRHGVLWEARQKLGSTRVLADYLGLSQQHVGSFINFKYAPGKKWLETHGERISTSLTLLLERSILIDDVFPIELMSEDFQRKQKRIEYTFFTDPAKLAAAGAIPALPSMPDEAIYESELSEKIRSTLATLTPREEKVIKMRFGLDGREHTLREVGKSLNVNHERVRQIEGNALRKLRGRGRVHKLKPFVEPNFPDKPKPKVNQIEKRFKIVSDIRREWGVTLSPPDWSPTLAHRTAETFYRHAERVFGL